MDEAGWWAGKDLHLRRRKPPDLQSGPVDYFGTDPRLKPRECTVPLARMQRSHASKRPSGREEHECRAAPQDDPYGGS